MLFFILFFHPILCFPILGGLPPIACYFIFIIFFCCRFTADLFHSFYLPLFLLSYVFIITYIFFFVMSFFFFFVLFVDVSLFLYVYIIPYFYMFVNGFLK